jgi:proteasome lid subunit RPN8/RPN11
MLQGLLSTAGRLFGDFQRAWRREPQPHPPAAPAVVQASQPYEELERLVLTDGVGRTLFDEYANHRAKATGDQETGWVLMGLREADHAVVLATLPAGAAAEASVTHVRFNSNGQAIASRMVRQVDRRLTILGVVHTHPGSLRHPSDADFRGDSEWVRHLRGREGIFGIGTADGSRPDGRMFVEQPRPHVQCLGDMCLSWYALRHGAAEYRPLPVGVTIGPDLARPLHSVWLAVEAHAERLERLVRQQAGVTFEVVGDECGPWLAVNIPVAEARSAIRVLLRSKETRYFLVRNGEAKAVECADDRVDRGVYLLLAELAAGD